MYSIDLICSDTIAFYKDDDNFPFLTALVKDVLKFYSERNSIVYTSTVIENGKVVFYNGNDKVGEASIVDIALFYLTKLKNREV